MYFHLFYSFIAPIGNGAIVFNPVLRSFSASLQPLCYPHRLWYTRRPHRTESVPNTSRGRRGSRRSDEQRYADRSSEDYRCRKHGAARTCARSTAWLWVASRSPIRATSALIGAASFIPRENPRAEGTGANVMNCFRILPAFSVGFGFGAILLEKNVSPWRKREPRTIWLLR